MFNFIKKLFGIAPKQEEAKPAAPYKVEAEIVSPQITDTVAEQKPTRTRRKDGKFIGDNPATPKNEAWSDGKSQAKPKQPRRPRNNSSKKPAGQTNKPKPQPRKSK